MTDHAPAFGAHMRTEIREQPDRWVCIIGAQSEAWQRAIATVRAASPELIVLLARGSSDHAALYGQYLIQNLLHVPVALATPSAYTTFGSVPRFPATIQIALSQSGRSPDLVGSAAILREAGLPLVAITNDRRSDLACIADAHLDLAAGPEQSVAATKSYTAELLAINTLVNAVAGTSLDELDRRIRLVASAARRIVDERWDAVQRIAHQLVDVERWLIAGRGYSMASAKEGALKLMETSRVAASGWSAADAAHGPLGQLTSESVVVVLTGSPGGRESVVEIARTAAGRGARILEIGESIVSEATWQIGVESSAELGPVLAAEYVPLLEIIPIQVLAAELAVARGLDPDRPEGLSKVTLTR